MAILKLFGKHFPGGFLPRNAGNLPAFFLFPVISADATKLVAFHE
jgi:hypothetical protein